MLKTVLLPKSYTDEILLSRDPPAFISTINLEDNISTTAMMNVELIFRSEEIYTEEEFLEKGKNT